EIPQLQPAQKIGVRIEPLRVREVRFLLPIGRAIAWILNFQRGSDDQHFRQTMLAAGLDDHSADARINRQSGELAPDRRERFVFIDRAQLKQRLVAVADRLRTRWIEKRKFVDRTEVERQQLQNDSSEVRTLNFRRGKPLAGQIVVLAVQSDANAGCDSPAAS